MNSVGVRAVFTGLADGKNFQPNDAVLLIGFKREAGAVQDLTSDLQAQRDPEPERGGIQLAKDYPKWTRSNI